MYVNRPEKIGDIRQAIREETGLDVEVEILLSRTTEGRQLADIPVEELIRESVGMPVEIEDLPEDEEG